MQRTHAHVIACWHWRAPRPPIPVVSSTLWKWRGPQHCIIYITMNKIRESLLKVLWLLQCLNYSKRSSPLSALLPDDWKDHSWYCTFLQYHLTTLNLPKLNDNEILARNLRPSLPAIPWVLSTFSPSHPENSCDEQNFPLVIFSGKPSGFSAFLLRQP